MFIKELYPVYVRTYLTESIKTIKDVMNSMEYHNQNLDGVVGYLSRLLVYANEVFPYNCIIDPGRAEILKLIAGDALEEKIKKIAVEKGLDASCSITEVAGVKERCWEIIPPDGNRYFAPGSLTDLVALTFVENFNNELLKADFSIVKFMSAEKDDLFNLVIL